jgi:hypothetical protein
MARHGGRKKGREGEERLTKAVEVEAEGVSIGQLQSVHFSLRSLEQLQRERSTEEGELRLVPTEVEEHVLHRVPSRLP